MATTTVSGAGLHASRAATDRFPASKAGAKGYHELSGIKSFVETGRFVNAAANPTVGDDTADGYVVGTNWTNTATGQRWFALDVTLGAAVWVSMDTADHLGYISGNWYMPNVGGAVGAGTAITTGSIRLLPMVIKTRVTISTLGCRITTLAAGGNLQLALYAHNPATGRPTGAALAVTASITTASAGVVSADITGADVVLNPGIYWMAVNVDATASTVVILQTCTGSSPLATFLIGSATQANIASGTAVSSLMLGVTQAYGTWPDLTAGSFTKSGSALSTGIVQFKVA